jgi:hypothetical protein
MHIKFINRGKGSASAAKEYLLQKHDHNGEIRADVQVLRGNPEHVTLLADSLEFKHRYTSGVIAWHKDDAPTDEQIAQVLDDFERVAFAGLEPNQYAYYAVLHEESNGAKHIHVVAPRVELSTGKSLNIAPPNWQKTYDVLVDKYNTKHNWASPKDLHRRKLVNNKIQLHSDMSHTKAKVEINKAVQELVAKGTIRNENDVTKYLNSIDGVTVKPRRSKKNLSIELEGIKKPIRLEGLAYAKGFNAGELRQELRAEQESRARETTADRVGEYERISEVLESIIEDRANFNRGRYIRDAKEHQQEQSNPIKEQQRVQPRAESLADKKRHLDSKNRGLDHDAIRKRIKSNLADTRGDVLRRAKEHNEDLRKTFKGYNHSVHKTDERSVGSDRTAEQHATKAERSVGEVREYISELADKFGRETSSKLRGLIYEAKGRVRELAETVGRFVEKAIEKIKSLSPKAKLQEQSSIQTKERPKSRRLAQLEKQLQNQTTNELER